MKRLRGSKLLTLCWVWMMGLLAFRVDYLPADASENSIQIKVDKIGYVVPEKRIKVGAEVKDPAGVKVVRCYFKAVEYADFVFIEMKGKPGSDAYHGVLPAPSKNSHKIEYLFLVVNLANQVVKTQKFIAECKADAQTPEWQQVRSEGEIQVGTELAEALSTPPGFSDSIKVDVAESSGRFGLVAGGIYGLSTGGGAAGVVSAGTVTASTTGGAAAGAGATAAAAGAGVGTASTGVVAAGAGLSTTAIIGIGAGAAVVGGIAIASIGSGGGSDNKPTVTSTTPASGETVPVDLSTIMVRFSERMDPTITLSSAVTVAHSTDETNPVLWVHSGAGDRWTDENKTLYISRDNSGDLSAGTLQITLRGFKSASGVSMDTYSFTFKLEGNVRVRW